MSRAHLETEIKLAIDSPAAAKRLLARNGFLVAARRVFESNTIFDTPDGRLRQRGHVLRIRQAGRRSTLTFKGPAIVAKYKIRPEVETGVSDPAALREILQGLGLAPVFQYEKYRTEYCRPRQAGLALIDETPIGNFLELEGPRKWIDRVAKELGYPVEEYITESYGGLYFADCARRGRKPGDLIFSGRK